VLVSFGDQIGFDNTLQGALDQVFGGNSGTTINNTVGTTTSTTTDGGTTTTNTNGALRQALANAQSAMNDANTALRNGDFTAYGKAQARLKAAIAAAVAAQK
jgi:uncharacterized membrane protein (UPF0182 family)